MGRAGGGGGAGRGGAGGGRGHGRRGAGGWRHRNVFQATGLPGWQRFPDTAPEQELAVLRQQAEQLGRALDGVRARIEELDASRKDQG
ncbi:MAG: DUF5320 domain-containing protein, partial [Acidobacteriota bacterium]